MAKKQKLRVWWIPQVPMEAFYIPVESPEEGQKVMNILATYDCFQYNHNVKPDYANAGGLQYFNEESNEWEDWCFEDDNSYYDDLDEYIEEQSDRAEEIEAQNKALLEQVHFD
jgi:hypothetical protein